MEHGQGWLVWLGLCAIVSVLDAGGGPELLNRNLLSLQAPKERSEQTAAALASKVIIKSLHSQSYFKAWTMHTCAEHCERLAWAYAALHTPHMCSCGNTMRDSARLPDATCSQQCNDGNQCGVQTDTHGDVVASVYGSGVATGNPMHAYRGCFDLSSKLDEWAKPTKQLDDMQTIGGCMTSCAFDFMKVAALGTSGQCLCRRSIAGEQAQERKCNNRCEGNARATCGGFPEFYSLYYTNARSESRVGDLEVQVDATKSSILMVQANGALSGGSRATQWAHMETRLNGQTMPIDVGGIYRRGIRPLESYSLLNMYPVDQGYHRVSLQSSVGGLNAIHGFTWQSDKTCLGQADEVGPLTPDECAIKCRAKPGCNAFSSNLHKKRECNLYIKAAESSCQAVKLGWMTGLREKRGSTCGIVPEGYDLRLQCPEGQVINEITNQDFGYLVPEARLVMNAPKFNDGVFEYLSSSAAQTHLMPGRWTTTAPLSLAAFGVGDVATVLQLHKSFESVVMSGIESFNNMVAASGQAPLTGSFAKDGMSGAAVVGDSRLDIIPMVVSTAGVGDTVSLTYYPVPAPAEFIQASTWSRAVAGDVNADDVDDIVLLGQSIKPIGCYYEKSGTERAVHHSGGTMKKPSPYLCMKICSSRGFEIFAIQGAKCWCTSETERVTVLKKTIPAYERYGKTTMCDECPRYPGSLCGTESTMGVYTAVAMEDMQIAVSTKEGAYDFKTANLDKDSSMRFRNGAANILGSSMTTGDFNGDGQVLLSSF